MTYLVDLLFDSSFLMIIASRPLARFDEIEISVGRVRPLILKDVLEELRAISRQPTKRARAARLALDYARKFTEVSYPQTGGVDEKLLRYAVEHRAAVATVDSQLKRRLREAGVAVVTWRGNEVFTEGF